MTFDIQTAHSVQEIGQETWERLGDGRPFASYRWYRFSETLLTNDRPFYILLYQGGDPIARAAFWPKRDEPMPLGSSMALHLMQALIRRRPLLMCQAGLASTTGLILPPPPLRDLALREITRVAQTFAKKNRASFVLFPYLERPETIWLGWTDAFASATVPGPGTRLLISWPDFESYLEHLSKSVKKDYRRHRNRAAELNIEVKRHARVTNIPQALALIHNVERAHNSPPALWARPALENAHLVDSTWLSAEIEGQIVGCGLSLGDRGTHFLALLGLDYEIKYAYFQLFYAAVESAIEQGVQVLRGGSGAYQIMQRLGFELESNNDVLFAGQGRLLGGLARWAAGNLSG